MKYYISWSEKRIHNLQRKVGSGVSEHIHSACPGTTGIQREAETQQIYKKKITNATYLYKPK